MKFFDEWFLFYFGLLFSVKGQLLSFWAWKCPKRAGIYLIIPSVNSKAFYLEFVVILLVMRFFWFDKSKHTCPLWRDTKLKRRIPSRCVCLSVKIKNWSGTDRWGESPIPHGIPSFATKRICLGQKKFNLEKLAVFFTGTISNCILSCVLTLFHCIKIFPIPSG